MAGNCGHIQVEKTAGTQSPELRLMIKKVITSEISYTRQDQQ